MKTQYKDILMRKYPNVMAKIKVTAGTRFIEAEANVADIKAKDAK